MKVYYGSYLSANPWTEVVNCTFYSGYKWKKKQMNDSELNYPKNRKKLTIIQPFIDQTSNLNKKNAFQGEQL